MTPPSTQPDQSLRSLLPWTLSFLRPYRTRVITMVVLMLAQVALHALQPWPLKIVIDYVLSGHELPESVAGRLIAITGGSLVALLITFVVAGVFIQILEQIVQAVNTQVQVDTGQHMVYDLRYKLFGHIESLALHHHVKTGTADSVYRVDVDAYAIENLAIGAVFPLATSVITLVVMFVVLLYRDVTVALLSLAVGPFLFFCLRYYATTISVREERVKELETKLIERLYETFSAIRIVKGFAREGHEQGRYAAAGDRTKRARLAITWLQSMFGLIVGTITIIGTGLILVVGGLKVMAGEMTVGDLTVVIAYLGAVYGPLAAIAHTTGQLQGAIAGARRVRAVLALVPETDSSTGTADAAHIKGEVRFDGVGFSYPDGTPVLHDIAFSAHPGEMVAVVGLTGAGKTTLVSLIPRLYEPTVGRVLVDGVDVRQYGVRALRERVAIVPQDPVLFSGTIADNLRYGRLDATDEEIEEAARAAHAHDFVSRLPKKYETLVAEAGGGLSGGERQRLSVARAVLKNAPILILDEPTSSLDAISEEIVFGALRKLRTGRTTIVIAHRLSTVQDADRILVLDGGQIAAQGKHQELLQTSQLYRRMCARLSIGKSLDDPETVDELIQATKE